MKFFATKDAVDRLLSKLKLMKSDAGFTARITASESAVQFDASGKNMRLNLSIDCEVERPGTCNVSTSMLASVANGLAGDLEFNLAGSALVISGEFGSSATIQTTNELPLTEMDVGERHTLAWRVSGADLLSVIKRVSFASDPKSTHGWAVGTWFWNGGGFLTIGGSEGHMFVVKTTEQDYEGDPFIIHDDHMTALKSLIRESDTVELSVGKNTAIITVKATDEPWSAIIPLVSAQMPLQAIQKAFTELMDSSALYFNVNCDHLETCCATINSIAEFSSMRMELTKRALNISYDNELTKFRRIIEVNGTQESHVRHVSPKYLNKVLKAIGDESVEMSFCEQPHGLTIRRLNDLTYIFFIYGMRAT